MAEICVGGIILLLLGDWLVSSKQGRSLLGIVLFGPVAVVMWAVEGIRDLWER